MDVTWTKGGGNLLLYRKIKSSVQLNEAIKYFKKSNIFVLTDFEEAAGIGN